MKLIEIKGLFEMDSGAPSPIIISSDTELFVMFYADQPTDSSIPVERNIVYDTGIITIKFKVCIEYKFGIPNDETISGHRYYPLGLRPYSFYELLNSDLIETLKQINEVHPYHNAERWKKYRHYILTFHDKTFECVAEGFEVSEENISAYKQASVLLNTIFARQI